MIMRRRFITFSFLFLTLAFTACQKEITGTDEDYKTLGTSAHEFLSSDIYTSLQVQISYMPGYQPDDASINSLTTFLNKYLNKPGGISVSEQAIGASGKEILTVNDIVQIEKRNRSVFTSGDVITAHILITDGSYSADDIFAKSYWNTSICLFGKTIDNNSGGPGEITRTQLITILLEHEFGHLLGLVGQGTPMVVDHRDPANGAHCDNPKCLMYYSIQTISTGLDTIPAFDANCLADLKANGSR